MDWNSRGHPAIQLKPLHRWLRHCLSAPNPSFYTQLLDAAAGALHRAFLLCQPPHGRFSQERCPGNCKVRGGRRNLLLLWASCLLPALWTALTIASSSCLPDTAERNFVVFLIPASWYCPGRHSTSDRCPPPQRYPGTGWAVPSPTSKLESFT